MNLKLVSIIVCLTLFLIVNLGCSPFVRVKIDSYKSDSIPSGKNYLLLSGMKDISNTDLQFKKFSSYLIEVLNRKGYKHVEKIEDSNLIVFMKYGIGDPSSQIFSYSVPIYGQVGGGVSTFTGTSYGPRGTVTTQGTIMTPPKFGQIGSTPIVMSQTMYQSFLILESFDTEKYRTTKELVPVWKTNVTSRGRMDDLRTILPIMIIGSEEYIGTDTEKQISVNVNVDDERVKSLRTKK